MSGVKGVYGGGGGGASKQGGGGACDQVTVTQDPCAPINPCQTIPPAPVQCKEIVDPCQDNQSGVIGGQGGGYGGQGGQVSQGGGYGGQGGGYGGQVSQGGVGVKK